MKGIKFGDIHSYDDLNLVLSEVSIPPATVKTNFMDIPGGDGSVDLTEALGEVRYEDRVCKFTFTVFPSDDFEVKKREVSNLLNGKRCKIIVDKDPDYYWLGRCSIDEYASDKNLHKIVVGAVVAPYKLKHNVTRIFRPVCGKNLIRYPYDSGFTYTANGVTFTANDDGSVTINGTSGGFAGFVLAACDSVDNPLSFFEDGKTYFLSGAGERKAQLTIYLSYKDETGTQRYYGSDREPFTWKAGYFDQRIYIQVNTTGQTFENYKVYPQLEFGSIATPYAQYTPNADITLMNGRKSICPTIICTDEVKIKTDSGEFSLAEGTHKVLDFQLKQGETHLTVSGSGTVEFIYQEGDL